MGVKKNYIREGETIRLNKYLSYKHHNQHPLGEHIGDCAVRAISYVTGIDYFKVKTDLSQNNPIGYMRNEVYTPYLEKLGYIHYWFGKHPEDRPTLRGLVNEHEDFFDNKKILIVCTNHMTVIDNKVLIDYYDCSNMRVAMFFWLKDKQTE